MRMRPCMHVAGLVALSVGALLWGACWSGAHSVGVGECWEIHGGGNDRCIQTNLTCPDPGGLSSTCTYDGMTQKCWQCVMNVPNWSSCSEPLYADDNCTQSIPANNPFCGTVYSGLGGGIAGCPYGCPTATAASCGSQIPNVDPGATPCNP